MKIKDVKQLTENREQTQINGYLSSNKATLHNLNSQMACCYTAVTNAHKALIAASKNPIHYTKKDLKHTSKWKKYIKKINNLINEEFLNMCLIKKTNNSYLYESNTGNQKIAFKCRFEGDPKRQKCTCVIFMKDQKIFHKTKKTPKRLYKEIINFIDFQIMLKSTKSYGVLPLVFPYQYQKLFISSNADEFLEFPELEKYDSEW